MEPDGQPNYGPGLRCQADPHQMLLNIPAEHEPLPEWNADPQPMAANGQQPEHALQWHPHLPPILHQAGEYGNAQPANYPEAVPEPQPAPQPEPAPEPAPVQLPNFRLIADQIARMDDLPIVAQGDEILPLLREIQVEIHQFRNEFEQVIENLQRDVHHIRNEPAMAVIRIHNRGLQAHQQLIYPANVPIAYPPLPPSRNTLINMTDIQCFRAAEHLRLPVPLPDGPGVNCRRIVAEYLGIGQFFF